jgi:hypothetical protein
MADDHTCSTKGISQSSRGWGVTLVQ